MGVGALLFSLLTGKVVEEPCTLRGYVCFAIFFFFFIRAFSCKHRNFSLVIASHRKPRQLACKQAPVRGWEKRKETGSGERSGRVEARSLLLPWPVSFRFSQPRSLFSHMLLASPPWLLLPDMLHESFLNSNALPVRQAEIAWAHPSFNGSLKFFWKRHLNSHTNTVIFDNLLTKLSLYHSFIWTSDNCRIFDPNKILFYWIRKLWQLLRIQMSKLHRNFFSMFG